MKYYLTNCSLSIMMMLVCVLPYQNGFAQKKNELQLLKISEDDDYLNFRGEGTDRNYTQGLKIELYYTKHTAPTFPGNLLMKISNSADNLYGWGLTQNIYTPNNIKATAIQYGDRPYAGTLYASHILVSSDKEKKQKLTTNVSLGVIGKPSLAGQAQTWVHGIINYQKPQGWNNQVKTDLILNYYILYERLLFNPTPKLEIIGGVHSNIGTLYNNAGFGIQFRGGLFNNYFSNYERPAFYSGVSNGSIKKFQFYFYMKTIGTAVMDDATLQGGFFTHLSSPYYISKDSMNRFTMQYEYGIVLSKNRFGISVSEKLRTAEFKGTYTQQIGNLTLYIGL
ncbi:hypothetical protein BH11BAC5_BH11BAC5_11420 [soil metagenome]